MRRSRLCLALLMALLLLGGCARREDTAAAQRRVVFVVKSVETQFWRSAIAGASAAGAEYNLALAVVGPETEEDFAFQNALIARAVGEGADAIVFSAISYTGSAAAIDAAAEAGVKIVVIDSDVDSRAVHARIGTDNVRAGRMTGAAVLDSDDGEICVGIVNFDLSSRNGQEREQGLREVLADDLRVRGVYTVNVAATPEDAEEGARLLLAGHPEIDVLVGLNEPLAVGVGRAVAGLGLAGAVRVVGFDTNVDCVDMMRAGVISALIAQNPYAMGYLGVEYAWRLLEGEGVDADAWLDTATTIVTRENMFAPESQRALFAFD